MAVQRRAAVLLLTACAIASAQPASTGGRFFPAKPSLKGRLDKRAAERLKSKMALLTELLAAAASPLRGLDAVASIRIVAEPESSGPLTGTVTGTAELMLRPLKRSEGEPDSLTFRINALDAVLGRAYLTDEQGQMYVEPAPEDRVGDHYLYRPFTRGSPVLVITTPNRPAFVPVSRERLIRARLAEASRLFEQMSSLGEAAASAAAQAKERMTALTSELGSTSATELASPAEIGGTGRASGLAEPGAPGARRVVAPLNLADGAQAGSGAIYVLTLEHSDAFGHKPELEAIRRRVDLARAAKIMD